MQKLRDLLFILMHLTLGSPSRATSLTILQLLNTDTMMRSFVVFGGDLFMMTRYKKQRSMIQRDVIGIKCFSPRLADIFVPYLILLRNAENAIRNHDNGGARLDSASYFTYYFVKEDGRPFSENGIDLCQLFSNCMASDGDGIPIRMRDYRQCAAAWIRCHVQQKHSVDLNTHLEAQFDHGESAGNLYGRTKDDPHSYTVMANAKFASARFYEFMSPVNAVTNTEANQLLSLADGIVTQPGNITSRPTVVYNQHTHHVVHRYEQSGATKGDVYPHVPNRMILLQKILQKAASAMLFPKLFASQEMKTCFETVLSSSKDFVVVLPTGSGKSLFWLYPAMLDHNDGDITIVIVPLVSVLLDQSTTFALQKNVRHIIYIPSITTSESLHLEPICDTVRVVFVQAEHVQSPTFKHFCNSMGTRLGRFIVDECHLMIEHRSFRTIMSVLMSTLSHYVTTQKVYVTATLPWKNKRNS
jgi:DEAD/DEAH box helicase